MRKKRKETLKYLVVIFLIISIYFIISKGQIPSILNIDKTRRYILSYGRFSSLVFILIYSLKPIGLIIPASIMSILAGNIFGPYEALILSMIGCFGSGTVAFSLSRLLGKSFVDKILKEKAVTLDSNIEKHGFKIMLIMRLAFIFPYDPLSFAAGLTKMKYRDFISATLIGILPEMVFYSFIGQNLENLFSIKVLPPVIMIVIVALTAFYIYKSTNKIKNNQRMK